MYKKTRVGLIAITVFAATLFGVAVYASEDTANKHNAKPIREPEFYGSPTSSISSGVSIPAGAAYVWTSGTVPPVINKDGKTVYEKYGDTKAQGIGVLKEIEKQLKEKGLSLSDVVYLRVYVAPDAAMGDKFDFKGWFDAYAQFFNTKENPVKPARSTIGVPQLVSSDWLIEIEAFAVYPNKHKGE